MIINIILLKTTFGIKEIIILIDKFLGNTYTYYWNNKSIKICEICHIPRNEEICSFPFTCFLIKDYINMYNLNILFFKMFILHLYVSFKTTFKTNETHDFLSFIFEDNFNIYDYSIGTIVNVINLLCKKAALTIAQFSNHYYSNEYNNCINLIFFDNYNHFILKNYTHQNFEFLMNYTLIL